MAHDASRYADLTLHEFTGLLASSEPVPGGGSASAVAGALAASLLEMVAALSAGRPRYAPYERTIARAALEGARAREAFLELADRDAAAYAAFSAAMKLPHETPQEVTGRRPQLQAAARLAAEVPYEMVLRCRRLIDEIEALVGRSNLNAASDLGVAALLTESAARGAAANVLVNLPSTGDERFTGGMTAEVTGHLDAIEREAGQVRRSVIDVRLREPESG